MLFKKTIFFLLLLFSTASLWAVPAKRTMRVVEQPDGTQLALTVWGDEHFHCFVTTDGVPVVRGGEGYYYALVGDEGLEPSAWLAHEPAQRSAGEQAFVETLPAEDKAAGYAAKAHERRNVAARQVAEVPTTGKVCVPVLLVQYKDKKFAQGDPVTEFHEMLNSEEPFTDRQGYASARKYFMDQSDGKFAPVFEVLGPVTLSRNMEYYGGNDERGNDLHPGEMIEEACSIVNSIADFKKYDNNGDGYVDFVYVIYAGYGEASNPDELENTIWPHASGLSTPLSVDGVKVQRYACSNELFGYQGYSLAGIGTLCHEFSHCLGLPDFYDTSSGGVGFGMNVWSIMDYGCYNNDGHTPCGYTAYEKDCLGWKPLVELDNPGTVTLKPLSEGGTGYKIVNEADPDEFYVVEYCRKAGWNADAPAEGMLVMHVDYLASAWRNNVVNNDPLHQRMTLIPADGRLNMQTLATDVWPGKSGNTRLTTTSSPAAKVYTGGYMYKDITDISMKNGGVTFSFMQGELPAPCLYEPVSILPSGFTIAWDAPGGVTEYEVCLDRLEKSLYLVDEDFAKVSKGNTDIGAFMERYTRQTGWWGRDIYGLDGAIRIGSTAGGGALMTPQFVCDSTAFTVVFTIRKSAPEDNDAFMVMAVGDSEWGDAVYGYGVTVEDKEWATCFMVIDTVGSNSYLYIDTREDEESPGEESVRIDLDDLYLLPGDRSKELSENGFLDVFRQVDSAVRPVSSVRCVRGQAQARGASVVQGGDEASTERNSLVHEGERYDEVPICRVRVKGNHYTFSELDGGLYRSRVRSVRGDLTSHYSNAVVAQLTDTSLPQTDAISHIYIDGDSMYIQAPDSAVVYYTTDGSHPTAYSTRYDAPFALGRKMTVRAMARRAGCRSSEVVDRANWFALDGATWRIVSTVEPAVMLTSAMDGHGYSGHYTFGDEVRCDTLTYVPVGVDSHAFRNATALRSVSLEGHSLRSVGDSLFHGCTALNAVIWDVDIPVKDNLFDGKSYHNLLLYLPDTAHLVNPLIDAKRVAVIKEGRSEALALDGEKSFYCPRPFVAGRVTCQRNFTQSTGVGVSAGWETIVLPFDVQHVEHVGKGAIAPFGVEAANHFWLSEFGWDAFSPATEMRANVPYIIAMPNNSAYGEHTLKGKVTFSAEQATIHATVGDMEVVGDDFALVPTYVEVEAADTVYALNLYKRFGSYAAGSVFVPGVYAVPPFSAYMVSVGGQGAPLYRIASPDAESEGVGLSFAVTARGGVVYIVTPDDRRVTVCDMAGRRVCTIDCKCGINEVTSLDEGLYIIETTKVYVER